MTIKELKQWLSQWGDDIVVPDAVAILVFQNASEFMERKMEQKNSKDIGLTLEVFKSIKKTETKEEKSNDA